MEKETTVYIYIVCNGPIQLVFLLISFGYSRTRNCLYRSCWKITAMGLMCGVIGINVGHELGHRNNRLDEFWRSYTYFVNLISFLIITWNHFNVTPKDAATARRMNCFTYSGQDHIYELYTSLAN